MSDKKILMDGQLIKDPDEFPEFWGLCSSIRDHINYDRVLGKRLLKKLKSEVGLKIYDILEENIVELAVAMMLELRGGFPASEDIVREIRTGIDKQSNELFAEFMCSIIDNDNTRL